MYFQIEGTQTRILGSIHLYPKDAPPPPARVEAAYQWAETICIEHSPAELGPFMRLPDAQDLEQLIPARTWKHLVDLMPPSADLAALRPLKLWAAFMSLARNALDAVDGVESSLLQNTPAGKLKTMESGLEVAMVFDAMPLASIVGALDYYGGDKALAQVNFRRMHAAWLSGDLAALWAVQKDLPLNRDPELNRLTFTVRNHLWAERVSIGAPQSTEKTLVVVGAGHLVGPDNLVDLLRARGHAVTSIT